MKKIDTSVAEQLAIEFGQHQQQGGSRLAQYCARAVDLSLKKDETNPEGKISADKFAEKAQVWSEAKGKAVGMWATTVIKYHKKWDEFAVANDLPLAVDLRPEDEICYDQDDLSVGWEKFAPEADAGADWRVDRRGGPILSDAYDKEASRAGTTKGMAIRAGSNLNAIKAAIKADPKVAAIAEVALTEAWEEKTAAFDKKKGYKPKPRADVDIDYIDVGSGVLGEAITALDVEIEKMERTEWVNAILRVAEALQRNVKRGIERFGYTNVAGEILAIQEAQIVLNETAFQFSDGFITDGANVAKEAK